MERKSECSRRSSHILGIVTIVSHRAHTDAVLLKSDANDKWSYFQSKRIKFHSLELGEDLLGAMTNPGPAGAPTLERYEKEKKRYARDSDVAQEDARKTDEKAEHIEAQALRFDFGEGLLEIGLVSRLCISSQDRSCSPPSA